MGELDGSVIELHKLGKVAKEISKELGTSTANVHRIARKFNLKFEGSGGKNRILNHNPFNDSEESWYWIGYIAADGNLSKKKYNVSIISKDIDHLLKFKKFVNADITEYRRGDGTLTLHFGNKEVHSYLIAKGITPNKSLTLKVNFKINRHFLRGVIDGDGCFSKTRRTTHKITSGSRNFLLQISEFLEENNISHKISIQQETKNTTYCLRIYNKHSKLLYDLLYKDATVFMERKELILRHASEMMYAKRKNSEEGVTPNPEPSFSRNTLEGATTNSRVLLLNAETVMLTRESSI